MGRPKRRVGQKATKSPKVEKIEPAEELFNNISPMNMECIMEVVLFYLPTSDLKESRLVCQVWNKEAAKLLMHRRYTALEFSAINFKKISARIPEIKKTLKIYDIDLQVNNKLNEAIDASKNSKYPGLLRAFNLECWPMITAERKDFIRSHGQRFLKQLDIGITSYSWSATDRELITKLGSLAPNLTKLKFCDSHAQVEDIPKDDEQATTKVETCEKITNLKQLIVNSTTQGIGTHSDKLEQRCVDICKGSKNLKSLQLEYFQPIIFLRKIFEIDSVRESLEKLTVKCFVFQNTNIDYLHTVSLPRLRVLRLLDVTFERTILDRIVRNFSDTLKKLKISRIMTESVDPNEPGMIVNVLKLLPNLEFLNWSQNFYKRSYKLFFQDLKTAGIVHEKLTCLKLKHVIILGDSEPVAFDLEVLNTTFPNLKQLELILGRREIDLGVPARTRNALKQDIRNRARKDVLNREMETLCTFPKLETLKVTIDDFSIGADVFGAISILEKSKTLKYLSILNLCEACNTGLKCDHPIHCNEKNMKKMFLRLRNLKSIQTLGFFWYFDPSGHRETATLMKDFAEKNEISLNYEDADPGLEFSSFLSEGPRFDSDDETEID